MSLRIQVENGETHVRVCPGCLSPLEWYESKESYSVGKTKTWKTEEQPRCDRHGWVTWWRILHVASGHFSGFARLVRGGRLHKRMVPRERVLAHMTRSLKLRHLDRDAYERMRNRHRGVIVKDSRQMDLFGGGL